MLWGNIVLRDRQHLSEDGIMIVVMTLERHSNVVLAGPDIVSRGFVYVRESEDLMDHAREVVELALDGCLDKGITDWSKIKAAVKDALSDYGKENFKVLLLNAKNEIIMTDDVSVGSLMSAPAHPREVFSNALRRGAASVILVHNHPSGNPAPSRDDFLLTERLDRKSVV